MFFAAALDVVAIERLDVEFTEAARDVVGIDGERGRHIVICRRTYDDVARVLKSRAAAGQ